MGAQCSVAACARCHAWMGTMQHAAGGPGIPCISSPCVHAFPRRSASARLPRPLLLLQLKEAYENPIFGGPTMAYMQPKLELFLSRVGFAIGAERPLLEDRQYPAVVAAAGALQLLGGLLVLLNVRFGAVLLLCFMVPTTMIMHGFWEIEEGETQHQEMIQFMKNLSIIGALMVVLAGGTAGSRRKFKYD
jgi:uncharacterized membrane protein YphA (DoxX/SURF4 family)